MKKIRMLKDDARLGFKKGEIYEVEQADYDPDKMTTNSDFSVYKESEGEEWEYVK